MLEYSSFDSKTARLWSLWVSAEASSGNVKTAQDVLEEMSETHGMVSEIEAELDCIASSIAFNVSVKYSLERFENLLEAGR